MSQKTYSAEEVAKAVLKKCHDMVEMKKSLFNDQKALKCAVDVSTKTKESCFWDIKWAVEKLKALKELSWTVESEAPEAKELFEKEFKKEKAKLSDLIAEHKKLKKSEDESEDEKNLLAKAEEMDKCGDMAKPMGKSDKLKNFLAKKDKKKALKKIGDNSSMAGSVAQTGGPSIASQIGFGKKEVKKARVDEGKSNADKRKDREARNNRQIGSDSGNAFGTPKGSKGVHKPVKPNSGESKMGVNSRASKDIKSTSNAALHGLKGMSQADAKNQHKKISSEMKDQKAPNLPKSEEAATASKAIGLKPITTGAEAPKVDNASKPPKAATTLKSFLAQKKK